MEQILAWVKAMFAIIIALFLAIIEPLFSLFVPNSVLRKDVSGKIVLVTGGGSGLGRLVAKKLAELGCIIVSWDINEAGNSETKKIIEEVGAKCFTYVVDLCDRHAIYRAADEVKKEVGKVDILINNAGIVTGKELLDCPDEMIQRTFDVNILSYIWTTKAFLPAMMESNSGQIVYMSSVAGFMGSRKQTDYSASKFAVRGFDMALTEELDYNGYTGIIITGIYPFFINTGMFDGTVSSVLPILDQETVTSEITDGIVMGKREVILPMIMRPLIGLMRLLSYRGGKLISKAFGTADMMNGFKGRPKKE